MTPEGAKATAKAIQDTSANPPVYAKVQTNGPSHESVVHVTHGQPREAEKTVKGQVEKFTPKRPRAFTLS
jgi:hypothetical protein